MLEFLLISTLWLDEVVLDKDGGVARALRMSYARLISAHSYLSEGERVSSSSLTIANFNVLFCIVFRVDDCQRRYGPNDGEKQFRLSRPHYLKPTSTLLRAYKMNSFKRRRLNSKSTNDVGEENAVTMASGAKGNHVNLPQKKRAIVRGSSPTKSPSKKLVRSNSTSNTADENTDDETLIREAEVALKNLSGSWPTSRNSFYNSDMNNEGEFESPAFENFFDEKQQVGHSFLRLLNNQFM